MKGLFMARMLVYAALMSIISFSCRQQVESGPSAFVQLAATPPMGWNSWNKFGCNVDENSIKEMAVAMVSSGMRDAGYRFIIIDDCWQVSRDSSGFIVEDPQRFPSGMKALADYVHSLGLKFGLCSCAGTKTCAGRTGSLGYELQDAQKFADWGVDYLKYDWCNTNGVDPKVAYPAMRTALERTGRPLILSMCEWGVSKPWLWATGVGHLWRTSGDVQDCWDCVRDWGGLGWTRILDIQAGLEGYAGPGHWNDPDMLQVGNGGMNTTEYRAHFSLWCLLAAPLMAGNDLRSMSDEIKQILMNKEVIAVDQDSLGIQGRKIRDDGNVEVWCKVLTEKSYALVFLNRSSKKTDVSLMWEEIGINNEEALVRDLWSKKEMGKFDISFSTTVPAHGAVMIKAKEL
jgi:alpha-galactosidase